MTAPFEIACEQPHHSVQLESLLDEVFGLARRAKVSYRLREAEQPVSGLSLVATQPDGMLVGAISFWHLCIGDEGTPALLLGPLAVSPRRQGIGIGRMLMATGLAKAKALGHELVLLVGDEPYYGRLGFRPVPAGQMMLPGPVDPARFLYLELQPGSLSKAKGLVLPPHRHHERVSRRASDLRETTSGLQVREAVQGR